MDTNKNCPFCGNCDVRVNIDTLNDEKHMFNGSDYCFPWCYWCKARGPNFYKVEMSDEEVLEYAYKLWNERREIPFSEEMKINFKEINDDR